MQVCCLRDTGYHMKQNFLDLNLVGCQCSPENRIVDVHAVVTNQQWETFLAHHDTCILLGAKVDESKLLLNQGDAAVICPRGESEVPEDSCFLSLGELFSGGFSVWTHAVCVLFKYGFDWSLDSYPMACNAYEHTHLPDARVTCPSEACQAMEHEPVGDNPPSFLFQTAVRSLWWMTFASGIICMSAPCPAWSLADAAPGLLRSDGLLILIAIFCTAILHPRLMVSENVANLQPHSYWRLVAFVIEWLNYKIHWNQALDLREIAPQARDRVMMEKGLLPNVHTAESLVINLQI